MSFWSDILKVGATGAATAINPGLGVGVGAGLGLLGGGNATRCPNQPDDLEVAAMLEVLPQSMLQDLSNTYATSHQGTPLPMGNAAEVGFAAFGGGDCQVSTTSGKAYRASFDRALSWYRSNFGNAPVIQNSGGRPSNYDPMLPVEVRQPVGIAGVGGLGGSSSTMLIVVAVVVVALVLLLKRK